MKPDRDRELAELIEKKLDGTISEAELSELQSELVQCQEARRLFIDLSCQHAQLREMGDSLTLHEVHTAATSFNIRRLLVPVAAAAALVLGFAWWWQAEKSESVATLVESENAAWVSQLPTTPGSELARGKLNLRSGIATIRFHSGAEVTLEAPANLELVSPMRGRLHSGSVVVHVPEEATGFMIDGPDSHVIDHGTEFAMSVGGGDTLYEVLEGEISVHHHASGESVFLSGRDSVTADPAGLNQVNLPGESGRLPEQSNLTRIGTGGREASLIRSNDPERLHPHFLMVKKSSFMPEFDRISWIGFDLSEPKLADIKSARIRLNLVNSGVGFASRLEVTSEFLLYGVPKEKNIDWGSLNLSWDDIPALADCVAVGSITIKRGQRTGSVTFESEELAAFLSSANSGPVSFMVVCETSERQPGALVHAFASSQHPEASGPALEINFKE